MLFLFVLTGATVAAMAQVKLDTLFSYGYRFDVFLYDLALQETLRGNFGLEYTYGSIFGDHAFVIFFVLLPIKAMLKANMLPFFILLGPIFHGISVVVVYFTLRKTTQNAVFSFAATLACLFSFSFLRGNHEFLYGCHIDTISGYVAIVFVSFLTLKDRYPNRRWEIAFWPAFLLFVGLKEEMALLGIFFFLMAVFLKKNRLYLAGLIVSCVAFAGQTLFIRYCQTEWNRTNVRLVEQFVGSLADGSFKKFLFYPGCHQFWLTLAVSLAIFATVFVFVKNRNVPAFCLFSIGLAKMAFGIVILDANITTWHNFPAVTMMTAAVLLQLPELLWDRSHVGSQAKTREKNRAMAILTLGMLLAVSFCTFIAIELPYWTAARSYPLQRISPEDRPERERCLAEIKKRIDPSRVISINGYSAIDFVDGYRYSFFPRGLSQSPKGIADYVVYDRVSPLDVSKIGETFEKEFGNTHYTLFRRRAIENDSFESRKRFTDRFGTDAVGAATFKILGE